MATAWKTIDGHTAQEAGKHYRVRFGIRAPINHDIEVAIATAIRTGANIRNDLFRGVADYVTIDHVIFNIPPQPTSGRVPTWELDVEYTDHAEVEIVAIAGAIVAILIVLGVFTIVSKTFEEKAVDFAKGVGGAGGSLLKDAVPIGIVIVVGLLVVFRRS